MKAFLAVTLAVLLSCCSTAPPSGELPRYVASSEIRTLAEIQHTFSAAQNDFRSIVVEAGATTDGRFIVGLTVDPDGSVSECHVVESTFDAALNEALLARVKALHFGSRPVPAYTVADYPIRYFAR